MIILRSLVNKKLTWERADHVGLVKKVIANCYIQGSGRCS